MRSISNGEIPAAINPKEITPPKEPTPSNIGTGTKLTIAASIVIIVLAIIGITRWSKDKAAEPLTDKDPAPAVVAQLQPLTDEQRFNIFLTENFIDRGVWQQNTLDRLKLKWLNLSQEQQQIVSGTKTFVDFRNALTEQIAGERKLDNVVPSAYEMTLITVARDMGLANSIPER